MKYIESISEFSHMKKIDGVIEFIGTEDCIAGVANTFYPTKLPYRGTVYPWIRYNEKEFLYYVHMSEPTFKSYWIDDLADLYEHDKLSDHDIALIHAIIHNERLENNEEVFLDLPYLE